VWDRDGAKAAHRGIMMGHIDTQDKGLETKLEPLRRVRIKIYQKKALGGQPVAVGGSAAPCIPTKIGSANRGRK